MVSKEIKIKLNTKKGQSEIKTEKLKGNLDCVIVDILEKIDIIIQSSLGYLILKRNQIEGINYFAPRIRIVPSENDLKDILTFDKFKLNEELLITVIGSKNIDVGIILRID